MDKMDKSKSKKKNLKRNIKKQVGPPPTDATLFFHLLKSLQFQLAAHAGLSFFGVVVVR